MSTELEALRGIIGIAMADGDVPFLLRYRMHDYKDKLQSILSRMERLEAVAKATGKVAKLMQSRLDDKPPIEVSNSTICEWMDELDDSLTELEAK